MIRKFSFQLRVFAPKDRLSETDFALKIAPACVDYYETHMKVNYSLPKLGKYVFNSINEKVFKFPSSKMYLRFNHSKVATTYSDIG